MVYVHRWWIRWCLYNVGVIINAVVSNIILYIGSQKETMKSGDVNSNRERKRFMRENNKKCYGVKMNTNKRCGSGQTLQSSSGTKETKYRISGGKNLMNLNEEEMGGRKLSVTVVIKEKLKTKGNK